MAVACLYSLHIFLLRYSSIFRAFYTEVILTLGIVCRKIVLQFIVSL